MAAQALSFGVPNVTALATTRRRYTVPFSPCLVQIYCASADVKLELVDGADGSAAGSAYETLPAGAKVTRQISRGEFCLSVGSGTPSAEVTAEPLA